MARSLERELSALEYGSIWRFSDWPNSEIPMVAAGTYTIWERDRLLYVGMSGRGESAEQIAQRKASGQRRWGLFDRLGSHASGRRSGDQFCVYVCDRLVLPGLSASDIEGVASGEILLDQRTQAYIRDALTYRFAETLDAATAMELEDRVKRGALDSGPPFLNPSRTG